MKTTILFISISIAAGLLLTNVYNSLIDTRSWGSDIPNSIGTARDYFRTVNPGDFYRIFSPLNQIFALIALIVFWKVAPSVRLGLGIALVLYVLVDALTFAYFYPRNDIMFKTAELSDINVLKVTLAEWSSMNWVRSLLLLAGLCCSFFSLHKIYLLHK